MFILILRILLIYWIISTVIKWISRLNAHDRSSGSVSGVGRDRNSPLDMNSTGKIDDAEFEEIDSE